MATISLSDRIRNVALSTQNEVLLKIGVIEDEVISDVSNIVAKWKETAAILYEQTRYQNIAEVEKYGSARNMAANFVTHINRLACNKSKDECFVGCYDAASQLQGIMLLVCLLDELDIEAVLTNPIHINSNLPTVANGLHGIGTSLIKFAEKICVIENYSKIELLTLPSSKSFYIHLGFHPDAQGNADSTLLIKRRVDIIKEKDFQNKSCSITNSAAHLFFLECQLLKKCYVKAGSTIKNFIWPSNAFIENRSRIFPAWLPMIVKLIDRFDSLFLIKNS